MNISSLSDQAQLILQQRLSIAAKTRMTNRVCTLHRAQKKLGRVAASGLRERLVIDRMINELTRVSPSSSLTQAK